MTEDATIDNATIVDVPGPDGVIGIVGTGRAGSSFATVLADRGWRVETLAHYQTQTDALDRLADHCSVVLLCVPDGSIGDVASAFSPERLGDGVVLAHCSGVADLDSLAPAHRRGSIHPLVSLNGTNPERLIGAWFAVAGDPILASVGRSMDGNVIEVGDDDRALYHAAAVIASNHLVALFGQVAAIADVIGVPLEAYLDLAGGSLGAVAELGPRDALTGPVSRGDWSTVGNHLRAMIDRGLVEELDAYRALAERAALLAGRDPGSVKAVLAGIEGAEGTAGSSDSADGARP